jgi:hypothetical protein
MPNSRRHCWKTKGAVVALAGMALAFSARADDVPPPWQALGLSGTLRGGVFSHDFSFDRDAGAASASTWFTAQPRGFWGVKAFLDGRVQAESLQHGSRISWELREGYVERSFGDVDVKFGRQIIVWGRADKVNPTDVWSVRDLTLLATDNEDQRLGATAVQANWRLGQVSLIGVWQPEWRTPIFPTPQLPAGLTAHNLGPNDPSGQFGLKIDHSGGGVDWSLSYAQVIDKTPDLRLGTPTNLDLIYQPIQMYGADAAVPIGQYGLRTEIAYNRRLRRDNPNTFTKYNDLFLVAGIERTFDGEFNVNVQYMYRRNERFQDPDDIADPLRRSLAQREAILANQFARSMSGVSVRIVDRFLNETLQAEISGIVWQGRGGGTLGIKLSYAVNDRLQFIVGSQIYFGPKTGFFGGFDRASNLYAEARWGF